MLGDAKFSAPTTAPTASQPVAGNIPAGIYQYYVTYVNGTTESRPSPASLQVNLTSPSQVNITTPADTSGQWSDVRVYRENLSNPGVLNQIADIAGGASASQTITDNTADVSADPTLQSKMGPPITSSTLLTNVLTQDSSGNYVNSFPNTGTLSFTGNRGGQDLTAKTFTVTAQSTVQDLMTFMQQALGIQTSPGPDPANPIPPDSATGDYPGGTVTAASQLQLVGNNGTGNAIGISNMVLTGGNPPSNATGQSVLRQSSTKRRGDERLGQRHRLRFAGHAAARST